MFITLFAYMIHVKDSPPPSVNDDYVHNNVFDRVNNNDDELNHSHLRKFLHNYDSCFADEIPNELPPIRGDNDHKVELIQGSSPPNKAPYRVLMAQQA